MLRWHSPRTADQPPGRCRAGEGPAGHATGKALGLWKPPSPLPKSTVTVHSSHTRAGFGVSCREADRRRYLGSSTGTSSLRICSSRPRMVLQHPELIVHTRRQWHLRQQEFFAGQLSEDQLLRKARGSNWNLCEAHFSVAMSRLVRGDRTGAREHFRLAVATRVYSYFEYVWARAFLTRMDKDPNSPGMPPREP